MKTLNKFPKEYRFSCYEVFRNPFGFLQLHLHKATFYLLIFKLYIKQKISFWLEVIKSFFQCNPYPQKKSTFRVITSESSKIEYDNMGDREHRYYATNHPFSVLCFGTLYKMGYRDGRDYVSKIIADKIKIPNGKFLDFGSGNGFNARMIRTQYPKSNIIGIDISLERIKKAKEFINDLSNIEFLQVNGSNLPFPDNYFDFVWSCHVFETMELIVYKALDELIRVMRHRALAVLIEPVWENANFTQRLYIRRQGYIKSLKRAIDKQNNIKIIEMFTRGIQGNPLNQSTVILLEKIA